MAPHPRQRSRRRPARTIAGRRDQGFDYYYGFIGGETDQWHPDLREGITPTRLMPPPGREDDYTLTEDLAEHARAWILRQKSVAPDRPVFMYLAPGAVHAPLQAPRAWIAPLQGPVRHAAGTRTARQVFDAAETPRRDSRRRRS